MPKQASIEAPPFACDGLDNDADMPRFAARVYALQAAKIARLALCMRLLGLAVR